MGDGRGHTEMVARKPTWGLTVEKQRAEGITHEDFETE